MILFLCSSIAADAPLNPFRIGFSSNIFTNINENDARASIKAWGQLIVREKKLPIDIFPIIFKTDEELLRALIVKEVDAVGILITEFSHMQRKVRFAPIFLTYKSGNMTESYVLLAHREGPVKRVADLRGRSLNIHLNPRTCLATLWLDTLLLQQGQPVVTGFVGKISMNRKLDNVVLPVFFRQSDACIITRSGFNTMSELNPQLAKQLIVLAESFEVVPALFAFRADYQHLYKDQIFDSFNELKKTQAGQQVLTIFNSDDIASKPRSTLESALKLIELHEKLTKGRKKLEN